MNYSTSGERTAFLHKDTSGGMTAVLKRRAVKRLEDRCVFLGRWEDRCMKSGWKTAVFKRQAVKRLEDRCVFLERWEDRCTKSGWNKSVGRPLCFP